MNVVGKRRHRRKFVGVVVSNSMQKTVVVEVRRLVKHRKYGKYIKRSTIYKTHDENALAKVGDKVEIIGTKPLSKTKFTKITKVIEKAKT